MNSRDTILQRVRGELTKHPPGRRAAGAQVWPRTNPAPAAMAEQFAKELRTVQGEVIRCATMQEAEQKLADLAARPRWTSIGAMDRPMVREAAADLPPGVVRWAAADWQPKPMAELSASVIEPEVLLADTGSCLIACGTAQDRLLCYLPPACVVDRPDRPVG